MSGRPSFLDQPAPANYVAGIGRGATGFTTRSDLGPARAGTSDEQMKEHLAARAKEIGIAPPTAYGIGKKKQDDEEEDEERFKNAEDEGGLLALGSFDQEDDEADRIYQSVDERMEKRRKIIRYYSCLHLQCSGEHRQPHNTCTCSEASMGSMRRN